MSFAGSASPKIGMSPSFGSSLGLAGMMDETSSPPPHTTIAGGGRVTTHRHELYYETSTPPHHCSRDNNKHHKRFHTDGDTMSDAETLETIFSESTPLIPGKGDHDSGISTCSPTSSSSSSNEQENEKHYGDPTAPPRLNFTLLTTVVAVTVGSSLQFGYGTGVMNNSEQIILDYFHEQGKIYDNVEWGTTVSCFGVGGLIGSVLGPKVLGRFFGRKTTLLISNLFLVISSALIVFAPQWYWQAFGRVFVGIVAGIATAVVPTYFAEISPIEVRGAIGTCHQLGITIGILLSQTLSTPSLNLLGSPECWKWLFAVPVFCCLIELIVLPFCPESPSYLYVTQGENAARRSLTRLQSKQVARQYLGYIREEIQSSAESCGEMDVLKLFSDVSLRKQLIVGITVQLMMQFSGIDAVFYYSTRVFYQADVADPELATTCLGLINVFVTIVAVRWMDSAGRKTLLTYSWIGMCTSYVVLTLSFVLKPYFSCMNQLSIVSMTGVIIFFAFGPGCIAWFIIAEIFPLKARDTAMAIGIFINWVANWLVAFTFPILLEHTQPYTFLIFVATTGFFLFFTTHYVPETKGRTVKEVSKEFEKIIFPWENCKNEGEQTLFLTDVLER